MSRRTVRGLAMAAIAAIAVAGTPALASAAPAAQPNRAATVNNPLDIPINPPATPELPPVPKVELPKQGKEKSGKSRPLVKKPDTSCLETGPSQQVVEKFIAARPYYGKVRVDGRQSPQDCKAIAKLQQRFGISPAKGYAGKVTGNVVRRITASHLSSCAPKGRLTVCVDLTAQTMWVHNGKRITLGPSPIRTGRAGMATPPGQFSITEKKRMTVSSYYKVKMPYWQRFYRDMGFHETPSYLYEGDSPGSHGCINVLKGDAGQLFKMTKIRTRVHIFGKKPA